MLIDLPHPLTFNIPDPDPSGPPHRMSCWQWGAPELSEAVLCVHGLTRNGRDFDYLADTLAKTRRVFCPDMPGRGKSAWLINPLNYSYPSYVADIGHLIKQLGLTKLHWIGTSMGGIIGMMAANAFPGLIASLTLNDVGCTIPSSGLKRILNYAGAKTLSDNRLQVEMALRERFSTFGITDESHLQHLLNHSIEETPDGKFRLACDPAISATFPKENDIKDIDLWPLWEAIKSIPVLLIRGADSDILPKPVAIKMQATHPRLALHEIAGTGHAPTLMADDQVALIKNWLDGLS